MSRNIPKIPTGMRRSWYRCRVCGRVFYKDYIPYSLSNPIITAPCGHDFKHDFEQITADEAIQELVP